MDFQAWGALIAAWPTDWIIICTIAVLIAFDSLRSGTARAAALMLSLPAAFFVSRALPDAFFLGPLVGQLAVPFAQAAIFIIITILLYLVAHRAIFAFSDGGGVVQSLITGTAAVIVLVVIWLQVPALESLWYFGDQVQTVFGTAYRFWWLVASYAALAFVRS
ncbi:hypothetical protein COU18_02645 [Candidatus Kaiserbacteria bacterium CG10_big_fil_rev_8_21_14_0_10_51_14]|uniref:CvpA family protein n=1 Tax=Candidatus Kaiserbacteria bacterium CG10_big_fil_rev_8_21_14_0_10_51_14 TaxID=1974610 RepID=A0A2H0UAX3_9BACT|nr:MAG: hypothetical protein COU18_02645 [Candidatus Kaiserbacteria bacterium CG10_big_fil_rev_8_21_14_0_10_51_14]